MDHMILPEGAKPWILVAYDGQPEDYYENQPGEDSFEDFPKRLGWKDEEVRARPQEDEDLMGGTAVGETANVRGPDEIEKFFQTWLFFGMIIEVFRLSDILVKTTDFLYPSVLTDCPDNERDYISAQTDRLKEFVQKTFHKHQKSHIVTTCKLPGLIVKWRQKHQHSKDSKDFNKVLSILDYVGKLIDHHCANGKDHRSVGQYGRVLWPVKDETTTSIIAVATMLRKAAYKIWKGDQQIGRWPVTTSRILLLRIHRKWCRSDAAMIMEDFNVDGHYYIAAAESPSLESLDGHYACTDHSCEAKIADGTYGTKHIDGCDRNDYDPEPKFIGHSYPAYGEKTSSSLREAVQNILDAHHLPVLKWDFEQKGLVTYGHDKDMYLEETSETPPYVAISHVWANGMGNPFDNSIPYCQLERIQGLVDDLCMNHLTGNRSSNTPGFWMDTLCCIVGDDEQSRKYKTESIKSMREIYHEAAAVLIIDPWLTSVPSTADMSEICFRVYVAGWSRRLWTHQEGFLGKHVFYQLQDKPLSLVDIDTYALEFQKKLARKGQYIDFPYDASSKTSFYYSKVKSIIDGIREGRFSQDRRAIYEQLAESLGYRSTTNVDDELLCVASVAGLNVKDYTGLSYPEVEMNEEEKKAYREKKLPRTARERQQTANLRMKQFLETIGNFNQGIIFNNYRRLPVPGFRWAPISLLGHRSSGLGDLQGKTSEIKSFAPEEFDDKRVEIPTFGWKVNLTKAMSRRGWDPRVLSIVMKDKRVDFPTVGLPVSYPGYNITFMRNQGLTINMAERRFGLKFSPISNAIGILKTPPMPSMPSMPSMPKVPSFGKVPKVGKLGSFGSKASQQVVEQVEKAPVVEDIAKIVTYEYVVFVAENNVAWDYDRSYVIILQKPLGEGSPRDFLAMIGLKSLGPGKDYWCSLYALRWCVR